MIFHCFASANRFFAHFYLVLYSGLHELKQISIQKTSLVCNEKLADIGNRYHIPDIIIMRSTTNYLGYKAPPYSFFNVFYDVSRMNVIADVVEAIIGVCCYYKNPIDSIRLVAFLLDLQEYAPGLIQCYERGVSFNSQRNDWRQIAEDNSFAELEKQVETLEEIQK